MQLEPICQTKCDSPTAFDGSCKCYSYRPCNFMSRKIDLYLRSNMQPLCQTTNGLMCVMWPPSRIEHNPWDIHMVLLCFLLLGGLLSSCFWYFYRMWCMPMVDIMGCALVIARCSETIHEGVDVNNKHLSMINSNYNMMPKISVLIYQYPA